MPKVNPEVQNFRISLSVSDTVVITGGNSMQVHQMTPQLRLLKCHILVRWAKQSICTLPPTRTHPPTRSPQPTRTPQPTRAARLHTAAHTRARLHPQPLGCTEHELQMAADLEVHQVATPSARGACTMARHPHTMHTALLMLMLMMCCQAPTVTAAAMMPTRF